MLCQEGSGAQGSTQGQGDARLLGASIVHTPPWGPASLLPKSSTGKTRKSRTDPEGSRVGRAAWGPMGWEQKFGRPSGSRARPGLWGTLTRSRMGTVRLSASPLEEPGSSQSGGTACSSQSPRAAPSKPSPKVTLSPAPDRLPDLCRSDLSCAVGKKALLAPVCRPSLPSLDPQAWALQMDCGHRAHPTWSSEERASAGQERRREREGQPRVTHGNLML